MKKITLKIIFCLLLKNSETSEARRYRNILKSANHKVTFLENFGNDFEFFVVSDPQYGKMDQKSGGDATEWDVDDDNVKLMCQEMTTLTEDGKTAFIMVTGDLAEAYPVDEGDPMIGRLPGFRSAQLADWLTTMNVYCPDIPILVTDGNHDIGNDRFEKHAWMGYEKQFGELWYYFQAGQRYFIVIDSQVYKLDDSEALDLRQQQTEWLHDLLENELPRNSNKTVFTHTPLFIEHPNEINAGVIDYSLPYDQRMFLLELFAVNNVDSIYSGHVHFENLEADSYVSNGGYVTQYVLTSINHQHDWKSDETGEHWGPDKPSYYRVKVETDSLTTHSQKLGLIDINVNDDNENNSMLTKLSAVCLALCLISK